MPSPLADAHILGQQRLRAVVEMLVARVWVALPGYDREHVEQWLGLVVPLVAAAQNQSAALTEAYLARALERQPLGVDRAAVVGAAVRNGTAPAEVYTRPMVEVWTALGLGVDWPQAVHGGMARATSTAAMDVQLTARATFDAVGRADPQIRGYRRAADAGACKFCQLVDGAFVRSASAMPLHNHCGCSLEPVRSVPNIEPLPDGVAVHQHGELGPVLGDPAHSFTSPSDLP